MSSDPTPEEAAEARRRVHRQRSRFPSTSDAPRWMVGLLLGVAASSTVGTGIAQDLLSGLTRLLAILIGIAVLAAVLVVLSTILRRRGGSDLGGNSAPVPTARMKRRNVARSITILLPAVAVTLFLSESSVPMRHTCVAVFWLTFAPIAFYVMRWWLKRDADAGRS